MRFYILLSGTDLTLVAGIGKTEHEADLPQLPSPALVALIAFRDSDLIRFFKQEHHRV